MRAYQYLAILLLSVIVLFVLLAQFENIEPIFEPARAPDEPKVLLEPDTSVPSIIKPNVTQLAEKDVSGISKAPGFHSHRYKVKKKPDYLLPLSLGYQSYFKVQDRLLNQNQLPDKSEVKPAELINYFRYDYPMPANEQQSFLIKTAVFPVPWDIEKRMLLVGLKTLAITPEMNNAKNAKLAESSDDVHYLVKAQLTFNSDRVLSYQLLGFEQGLPYDVPELTRPYVLFESNVPETPLVAGDHEVVFLFELQLNPSTTELVEDLRYHQAIDPERVDLQQFAQLNVSYRLVEEKRPRVMSLSIDQGYFLESVEAAGADALFAVGAYAFGQLIQQPAEDKLPNYSFDDIINLLEKSLAVSGIDSPSCKADFLSLVLKAKALANLTE